MNRIAVTLTGIALSVGFLLPSHGETNSETPAVGAGAVSFYREVRPILQARCHGCHQPAKAGGGYVMTSVDAMQHQGDSELAGIVPGQPEASFLVEQITPKDGFAEMPQEGDALTAEQIDIVTRWIAQGAVDDTPESARRRYDALHPPEYSRPPVITSLDILADGSHVAVAGFHEVYCTR